VIVRGEPGLWQFVSLAARGSILPRVAPSLVLLALWSAFVVWAHGRGLPLPHSDITPFTVLGIALALFHGFRNNASWDRWWEGRSVWGNLVAGMRSLARETAIWIPDDPDRKAILRDALAFMHLHRLSLRGLQPDAAALRRMEAAGLPFGPPGIALNAIANRVSTALHQGRISEFGARALAERLAAISADQTGAERIALTPMPFVYSLLIYRTTWAYCLLLPLALSGATGWLAPLFTMLVGYVFLGLAKVTEDLTNPFGKTDNALPLDAICRIVEMSLAVHLDEERPPPLEPVDHLLT
jgi:ion channel-forming bestrophin family protein